MSEESSSTTPSAPIYTKKRTRASSSSSDIPPTKTAKIHPFFTKPSLSSSSTFKWLRPSLGPKHTCLHGVNGSPPSCTKVAAFDLDGTIVKSNHKDRSKSNALHWQWWRPIVPAKLKDLHTSGFSIVLLSNQFIKPTQLEDWKRKIPLIAASIPDIPFRIFAATARDGYRKPMPGMWYELEKLFGEGGISIDKSQSFFVGDAAGRDGDFSSTDRKLAINLGLSFLTPEEYFLSLPQAPYKLSGFHVSSLSALPSVTPISTPLHPKLCERQELVLFVGYPCLGKSTFYRRHFESAGYAHINQDTLGTRAKCIKAAEAALLDNKSCVIDNTNRDVPTRRHYINLARKLNIPARCFVFTGSIDLAWHNNLYRACNMAPSGPTEQPGQELLPHVAFTSFRDNYEEPQLEEGFSEIKIINWVFEGNKEDERRWKMWLQIDGK